MKKKCLKIILAFMLVMVITFQHPVEAKAFSFGDIFNNVGKIFNNGLKFLGNTSNSAKNFGTILGNLGNLAKKYDQSGLGDTLSGLAGFVQDIGTKGNDLTKYLGNLPQDLLSKAGISQDNVKALKDFLGQIDGMNGKNVFDLTSLSGAKSSLSTIQVLVDGLGKVLNTSGLSATDKQNAMQALNKVTGLLGDLKNALNLSDDLKSSSEYQELKQQYEELTKQADSLKKTLSSGQSQKLDEALYVYTFDREKDPSKYSSTASSVDDIIKSANAFLQVGEDSNIIDTSRLQTVSKFVSGVLLTIAIAITVISAAIMGIKFMTESVEDKAKIKESMTPWVIGILVAFGAFAIWQVTINIMSKM